MALGRSAALTLVVLVATAAAAAQGPPPSQSPSPSGGASPGFTNVTVQNRLENMTTSLRVENKAGVPVRLMGCPGPLVQPGQTLTVPVAGLSRFWVAPADAKVDCHTGPFEGLFYFSADLLSQQPVVTIGYTNKTGPEASTAGNESKIATVQLSSAGQQGGTGGQPAAQGQPPSAPAPAQGQQSATTAQGQQSSTPAPAQLQQGQEPSTPAPGEAQAQGQQQSSTPAPGAGAQAQGQQPSTPTPGAGAQAQGQQPSTPAPGAGAQAQGQQPSTPAPGAQGQQQQEQGEQGLRSPVKCRMGGCDPGTNFASLPSELTFTIMSAQPAQPSLLRGRHGYGR